MSCADWMEGPEAEARTGIPARGFRTYRASVEEMADNGDVSNETGRLVNVFRSMSHVIRARRTWPVSSASQMLAGFT